MVSGQGFWGGFGDFDRLLCESLPKLSKCLCCCGLWLSHLLFVNIITHKNRRQQTKKLSSFLFFPPHKFIDIRTSCCVGFLLRIKKRGFAFASGADAL